MLCRWAEVSPSGGVKQKTDCGEDRKEGTRRSLFETEQLVAISLPGNICGNDHGFLLLVVLGEPDFRAASGQFASDGITCNPNLPEEIVTAHAVENELGVCRGSDTFASV